MRANILFVFEGTREANFFSKIQNHIKGLDDIVHFVFDAEIYQLFRLLNADPDLDVFNLLKERSLKFNAELESFKRDDFAQIYFFFDYDGHASKADDSNIKDMLDLFNEETENGRLFISYPMLEAFHHIQETDDSFRDLNVKCKVNIGYKQVVNDECKKGLINDCGKKPEAMKFVLESHLKKANFLLVNEYVLPEVILDQKDIFIKQLTTHIQPNSEVAVLSCLPLFLQQYFGVDQFNISLQSLEV